MAKYYNNKRVLSTYYSMSSGTMHNMRRRTKIRKLIDGIKFKIARRMGRY